MNAGSITDMRDFALDDSSAELPAPARRMRDFLGGIVRAATASERREFVSCIPCRRRPGNQRCPGSIAVHKTDLPEPFIFWECTVCGDDGRIAHFKGCPYDLNPLSASHAAHDERRCNVVLTADEYRSWTSRDMLAYDLESMRAVHSAVANKRGIVVPVPENDLDALCDSTAADANHEANRKRRENLYSICDKLSGRPRQTKKRPAACSRKDRPGASSRTTVRFRDPGSAYAHGFFSATVAGPMVMPMRWLPLFLPQEHESIDELNAAAARVFTSYNHIADLLATERHRFGDATLEIARRDATGHALVEWQQGFFDAMDINPDEWQAFLSSLPRKDLLSPLAMISQFAEDPRRREWLADQDLRENLARSVAVMTVRLWEAYRDQPELYLELEPETEKPKSATVGRNAPCPCGSGKKYKRCCGSTLRVV